MKILFSPSETKFKGGESKKINKNSFLFPELFEERIKVVNLYQTYIDCIYRSIRTAMPEFNRTLLQ